MNIVTYVSIIAILLLVVVLVLLLRRRRRVPRTLRFSSPDRFIGPSVSTHFRDVFKVRHSGTD